VLDEKLISPLSLVDAVIRDSSLSQRPSQTKVELTSSHDTPSTGSAVVQGGGGKSESTGEPMEVERHSSVAVVPPSTDVPPGRVTVLRGHESEVFTCAWSPSGDIIVSG